MYTYKEKDSYGPWGKYRKNPYRNRYCLVYTNTNPALLKEFRKDIICTFGIRGKSYSRKPPKTEVRITSLKAYKLLTTLGAGNSFNWRVPKEISSGPNKVQKNWIRAFFDDEADFDEDSAGIVARIRVKCVNKPGLTQVKKMLNKFLPCHLNPKNGFYWGKTVCLNINKADVNKYFSKIGSIRYHRGVHRKPSVSLSIKPA